VPSKAEGVLELHNEAIIVDMLNSSLLCREYFEKLSSAGVTAINYTVAMNHSFRETIMRLLDLQDLIDENKDIATFVTSAREILEAKKEGKVGIIAGFQNIAPLEGDLRFLRIYENLGVRIIQLSYHFRNIAADGCKERTDSGLSEWGVELVKELNKLNILIDLAHVGRKSVLEAIELSRDPVIASHCNPRNILDVYQNKTDEEIMALAEKGGVIGVTAFPRMLCGDPDRNCTIERVLDCIDYVVNLVGVNHVGIGLDFAEGWAEFPVTRRVLIKIDGRIYTWPKELRTITDLPNLTKGLIERGYSKGEIKKILGLNFLRVFREVVGE